MENSFVIPGLIQNRAEVAGIVADLEKRAGQARADLAHIDATLCLFDPTIRPATIPAKSLTRGRSDYFAAEEMSKRCRNILRLAAGASLSADETVRKVMVDKMLDPADSKLRTNLIRRFLGLPAVAAIAGNLNEP